MPTLRTSNGAPFTVLAPQPHLDTGIEIRVYDGKLPANLLDVLPRRQQPQWYDPHNDGGWGSFMIHKTDPKLLQWAADHPDDPDLIAEGRLVRFRLEGIDRYTMRIESR